AQSFEGLPQGPHVPDPVRFVAERDGSGNTWPGLNLGNHRPLGLTFKASGMVIFAPSIIRGRLLSHCALRGALSALFVEVHVALELLRKPLFDEIDDLVKGD